MSLLLLFLLQADAGPAWRFLAEKYDADGDGAIAAAEYPRGAASFARLDRDGDGALSPADFAERHAALWREQYLQAPQLQEFFLRNFQHDADPGLQREEFLARAAAADRDADGSLDAAEFHALVAASPRRPDGIADLRTQLALTLDPDRDDRFSLADFAAAFDRLDVNQDRELVPQGQPPERLPLQPEDRPLALIFGSFT